MTDIMTAALFTHLSAAGQKQTPQPEPESVEKPNTRPGFFALMAVFAGMTAAGR